MRAAVAAVFTSAALVMSGGAAVAAPSQVDVKIGKKVTFEIQHPQFSQVAVPLKVKCDPSVGSLSLNVQVFQNNVAGFGFLPGIPCTGKTQRVTAHVQSNFGSVYLPGPARVVVTDFVRGQQYTADVTIR